MYWQGPSIGYDAGGEGSKTMVLVYNLRDPWEIYQRYAGVQGSAYFVGGIGIQFQTHGNVTLAPIRAGVGLRLGANIGYLKYTPQSDVEPVLKSPRRGERGGRLHALRKCSQVG